MPWNERRWRADLLLQLDGAVHIDLRRRQYGIRPLTWIELKGFFESTRSNSEPPKTARAGLILRDLLRVCLLPQELHGKIRQNARYILVVFANPPNDSLPFRSGALGGRPWLDSLFTEGKSIVNVSLANEPRALRCAVGRGFDTDRELSVSLSVRTHVFEPDVEHPRPVFWGYLIQVKAFTITTAIGEVSFADTPDDEDWPADRIAQLGAIRNHVTARIRNSKV